MGPLRFAVKAAISGKVISPSHVFEAVRSTLLCLNHTQTSIRQEMMDGIVDGALLSGCSFKECSARAWMFVNLARFADQPHGPFRKAQAWIQATVDSAWHVTCRKKRAHAAIEILSGRLLDIGLDPMDTV